MTTFTLEQLREGITKEEAIAELKSILEDQGIDTTTWKDGDPAQNFLQLQAHVYSQMSQRNAAYLDASFNTYASGSGLTILSDSYFDNQRITEQKTEGDMVLSASSLFEFPQTWLPGELQVTDGTYVFENVEQILLSTATNPLTASFRAIDSGEDYNIAVSSSLSSVESFVGLSVTNPVVPDTATWITTQGNDREDDAVLKQRNSLKWSSLQASEYTVDRTKALALSASANIFYVSIDDENPRGAGTVDVYISKRLSTAAESDAQLVNTKFNQAFFGNINTNRVSASLATEITFSSSIDIYYSPGSNISTIKSNAEAAVDNWIANTPIGGRSYFPVVSLSNVARINDLIRDLESIDGVETTTITPNTDLTFQKYEKLVKPSSYGNIITYTKLSI